MVSNKLTLKQLEAFVAIVRSGTFRKAAKDLGTTQPNISSRISSLENALGVKLMDRNAGSVCLTEKGAELLEQAKSILHSAEEFLEQAGRLDLVEDRLRLGVTELVACTWLHDFLRRMKSDYPAVRVELTVEMSQQIETDLVDRKLDLAFQTAPFSTEMSGTFDLSGSDYVWVAHSSMAGEIVPKTSLSSLFEYPVLVHARKGLATKELAQECIRLGLPTSRIVYSNSLSACVQMARDGLGIALLPERIVAGDIDLGHLSVVQADWLPSPLRVFARFDAALAPRFVLHAAKIAQELIE